MMTVILERAGIVLEERDISVMRRAVLTKIVQDFHCFHHGEPHGVARVDVGTLECSVDRVCCPVFREKLDHLFGL